MQGSLYAFSDDGAIVFTVVDDVLQGYVATSVEQAESVIRQADWGADESADEVVAHLREAGLPASGPAYLEVLIGPSAERLRDMVSAAAKFTTDQVNEARRSLDKFFIVRTSNDPSDPSGIIGYGDGKVGQYVVNIVFSKTQAAEMIRCMSHIDHDLRQRLLESIARSPLPETAGRPAISIGQGLASIVVAGQALTRAQEHAEVRRIQKEGRRPLRLGKKGSDPTRN